MILTVVFIPVFVFFLHVLFSGRRFENPHVVRVYFGIPGSGKTTYAAHLCKHCRRSSIGYRLLQRFPNPVTRFLFNKSRAPIDVFSNVPILGTYKLDPKRDLGVYMVQDAKIIIDEASIEFNNRKFKDMPQEAIKFFKLHRHYGTSIDVFSQSFDDMDITLRRLAHDFFLVKKSFIPFFICVRKIRRKVGIDDNTHQISDLYQSGSCLIPMTLPSFLTKISSVGIPSTQRVDFLPRLRYDFVELNF